MDIPDRERTVRVALVDTHPIIRAGLSTVLTAAKGIELLAECSDLEQACSELKNHDVDVVILGSRNLSKSTLEDLHTLGERLPHAAPVVFTTSQSEKWLLEGLLAGARGYLVSDSTQDDIVDAIRVVGGGKNIQVPANLLLRLLKGLPWTSQDGNTKNPQVGLARMTNRELEVLQEMATGKAYRLIADKLFLAESTVKKYAHSVITKLGASNRSTAVLTAYRFNLLDGYDIDSAPDDE